MKLLLIDDSPDAESSLQDLVRQADEALYQAKNSGRDKVCPNQRNRIEPSVRAALSFAGLRLNRQPRRFCRLCCSRTKSVRVMLKHNLRVCTSARYRKCSWPIGASWLITA